MTSTVVVGSTGVVGSRILATLLALPNISSITTLTRRASGSTAQNLNAITSAATETWPGTIAALAPAPTIYFSALGTTRSAAGGLANQRKIDVDLNLSLASAAHKAGSRVCVLISSSGADSKSMVPYTQMKGELEDKIGALGFEHFIVLRPGFILGDRPESRWAEGAAKKIISFMPGMARDRIGQDKEIIARAAVAAGLRAAKGEVAEKVWVLGGADILRLGATEWKA